MEMVHTEKRTCKINWNDLFGGSSITLNKIRYITEPFYIRQHLRNLKWSLPRIEGRKFCYGILFQIRRTKKGSVSKIRNLEDFALYPKGFVSNLDSFVFFIPDLFSSHKSEKDSIAKVSPLCRRKEPLQISSILLNLKRFGNIPYFV